MYIFYTGPGKQYAAVGVSKRNGSKTSVESVYLGKVLDREAGIYQNKERGVFTFDPETGDFGPAPVNFVPESNQDKRKRGPKVSVDFGDAYFMHSFLQASGLMEVVDEIGYGNPDTLHAMLLFYTLSGLANTDAIYWFEGSVARLLYPKANLTSQRISDFLATIGTPEKQMAFQKAYIDYVFKHYSPDTNILVDSSGLPNSIHFPLTHTNIHNGKVSNEVRLIFVVQKSTGLPLYYRAVPGNIVDVSTLKRIFLHLESMGIDIDECIIDAGYCSGENLDLFYDDEHNCKIGYITRVSSLTGEYKKMIEEDLPTLDQKEYFVKFEDRFLFIKKKKIFVGSKKNQPAWLYLGLDINRSNDERHKLLKRAKNKGLSEEDFFNQMQTEGVFGILSGKECETNEILPGYYQRQSAEQIFDFAKNYTKLLPLRISTVETFNGHLLLSYIAACAVKMIQLRLKEANLFLGSRLVCLRNQKCTIYANSVVTDEPQKIANDTYKAFGISCPESAPIVNGRLNIPIPKEDSIPKDKKKPVKRTKKTDSLAQVPKKRGRPKGSKNKKTIEREAMQTVTKPKRGRGRPKGSRNKPKTARAQ